MLRALAISPLHRAKLLSRAAPFALLVSACQDPEPFHRPVPVGSGTPVTCHISRGECDDPPSNSDSIVGCGSGFPLLPFVATACTAPEDGGDIVKTCHRAFCERPATLPYSFIDCNVDSAENASLPVAGVCTSDPSATGQSSISFFARSRPCDMTTGHCVVTTDSGTKCVDVTAMPSVTTLLPPKDHYMRSVEIIQYQPNGTQCVAATQSKLTYALPAGPLGTATGGGLRADVSLVNGFATVGRSCDVDTCVTTSLDDFHANVADFTVSGVPLTNVALKTAYAAPIQTVFDGESTSQVIAAGDLKLFVDGQIAGQRSLYTVGNRAPITVDTSGNALGIFGTLDVIGLNAAFHPVPVTFTANVQGRPATQAEQACSAASPAQRVFGFESPESWTSSQAALSEVTSPVTQGCGALSVRGQGYLILNGDEFSTQRVTVLPSLSVDLFIPDHQPNAFWLGALQMFLSCPSGSAFNQYIGQVELTGKPQNAYSTLRLPLPSDVSSTLHRSLDDCSISITLNINPTGQSWLLDNLRFTQ